MKALLLLLVFGCAVVSFVAFTAANTNVTVDGYNWATQFCSSAHGLCAYPQQLAYGAIGCAVVWLMMLIIN